jgi:cold shock CspA family protein
MAPSKKTAATTKTAPVFSPPEQAVAVQALPVQAVAVPEAAQVAVPEAAQVAAPVVQEAVPEAASSADFFASGCVKWFNNKAGYGFITVNDCETNEERDMFVHHSEIKVDQSQYKYLVQGEYVEFVVGTISRENKIDAHATKVRGINGGKLMCETRNEVRLYRSTQQGQAQQGQGQAQQGQGQAQQGQGQAQQGQTHGRPPRQAQQGQAQQQGQAPQHGQAQQHGQVQRNQDRRPQLTQEDQSDWMVVPRRRADTAVSKQRNQPRQRQPEIEIQN